MARILSSRFASLLRGSLGLTSYSIKCLTVGFDNGMKRSQMYSYTNRLTRGFAYRSSMGWKSNITMGITKTSKWGFMPHPTNSRHLYGQDLDEEALEKKFEDYFNRNEIDGWEVRRAMNDLMGMDLVISPPVIIAGLKACRRINDVAVAIRWLEGCKEKCADDVETLWPHILEEIKPTLSELGIPTPDELGWDKPELALKSVFDM